MRTAGRRLALGAVMLCACAHAQTGPFSGGERRAAEKLKSLHQDNPGFSARVEAVSAAFLGTPYELGPLGEGPEADFDRDPMHSFDKADCTTFVEEVMALSLEADLGGAWKRLDKIRYHDGRVSFEQRNHFPEVDWLPNNIAAGYLKDITREVAGDKTREATKLISKRDWYHHMSTGDLKGFDAEPLAAREARAERLRRLGDPYEDQTATIPYVPLSDLPALLDKIPSGTVGNLVREPRSDRAVIVTHQLLFVRKDGKTFVRHAASGRAVEDVPAADYFARYAKAAWPLLGVNLDRLRQP